MQNGILNLLEAKPLECGSAAAAFIPFYYGLCFSKNVRFATETSYIPHGKYSVTAAGLLNTIRTL
jgi:hypothetical protein